LTNVTIANGSTRIANETFEDCTNLTSVTIPGSVTNIGIAAFAGCGGLTKATIANGVTSIGIGAFYDCAGLTNVTIPGSVTTIGDYAFWNCTGLTRVYFEGNAPAADSTVFTSDPATACYLPGAAGWSNTFAGVPTAPWFLPNPTILHNGASLGVESNAFAFTISWATNASVVVEAATNLVNPVWVPIRTNVLTNGSFSFSDPKWTNYSGRFYRLRSP
jgi:hypothetical protein